MEEGRAGVAGWTPGRGQEEQSWLRPAPQHWELGLGWAQEERDRGQGPF